MTQHPRLAVIATFTVTGPAARLKRSGKGDEYAGYVTHAVSSSLFAVDDEVVADFDHGEVCARGE